jgi:hypothetical protein
MWPCAAACCSVMNVVGVLVLAMDADPRSEEQAQGLLSSSSDARTTSRPHTTIGLAGKRRRLGLAILLRGLVLAWLQPPGAGTQPPLNLRHVHVFRHAARLQWPRFIGSPHRTSEKKSFSDSGSGSASPDRRAKLFDSESKETPLSPVNIAAGSPMNSAHSSVS